MQVLTSTSEIEMWGDGKQTRSFTFIDDCVEVGGAGGGGGTAAQHTAATYMIYAT